MQFVDLKKQQEKIRDQINANIGTVLDHGRYIMGPEVRQLEDTLADFVASKHAIACSSGTDALLMALMTSGIGPGDAILTSPFTFIATAEVIQLLGATPVFVDIDPKTFNIDPHHIERAISGVSQKDSSVYPLPGVQPLTPKGIIAVDIFGLPADYRHIRAIADQHNLFVIEDAAQSLGASQHGTQACALGDIGCTSFFPAKPLGCYGDGGMCFTDDDATADQLRSIRVHGKGTHKYDNCRIGVNGRLDTLQAAILLAKFEIFEEEIQRRRKVADRYHTALMDTGFILPELPAGNQSAWAQYSLLASNEDQRNRAQAALKAEEIPSMVYYPKPLHLQTAFAHLAYKPGDFPVSELTSERIFSLPMHPYLSDEDQRKVTKTLKTIS